MLRTFSHTCLLLLVSTLGGHAAIFDFHTFWAKTGDISPDKRFIQGDETTLYDAKTFQPRYQFSKYYSRGFFTDDSSQYIYIDVETGLHRYTFATGNNELLVDLPGVDYTYRSADTRSYLFTKETGNGITLYSKLAGQALVELASFKPESLEEMLPIEIESHPEKDIVLFEVQEYSRPSTPMGDGIYGPRKIYELNVRTKALKLVVEWPAELKSSITRPIAAGSDTYEYTEDGAYILFNPKTGEITRKIAIPNVKFALGKVGEIEAKRAVTEDEKTTYFLDIVASGTLKTIRNIPQMPPPADRKWGRSIDFPDASPEHAWFINFKTLTKVDVKSWTVLDTYKIPISWPNRLSYDPNKPNHLLFFDSGDYYSYNLENQRSEILNPKPNTFALSNVAFHPTEPEFYGIGIDGNVHRYRLTEASLSRANLGKGAYSMSITNNAKHVFSLEDEEGWMRRYALSDFPRGDSVEYEAPFPNSTLPKYNLDNIYTETEKYFIQMDSFQSYLHDFQTGKFIAILEEHGHGDYSSGMVSHPIAIALAPDDSAFVSLQTDSEYSMETRESSQLTRLSYTEITSTLEDFPEPNWSVILDHENHILIDFIKDGSSVLIFNDTSGELLSYSAKDGKLLNRQTIEFKNSERAISYDRDRRLLLQRSSDSELQVVSLDDPSLAVHSMHFGKSFQSWNFFADTGYIAISSDFDPTMSLYQYETDFSVLPVGDLTFYNEGDDFLFSAANGRFDATQPVVDGVLLKKQFTFQPLNQIYEQSYEPGLLLQSLSGIELASAEEQLDAVVIPPIAELSSRATNKTSQIELTLTVSGPQHQLERYDLFQNEKLIRTSYAFSFKEKLIVDLLPDTNEFKLIATDVKGFSSSPAIVTVRPPEAFIQELKQRTAERRLHILAVGIDDYTNPQHQLNYAVADASAVLKRLESLNTDIFDSVQTTLITNAEADKGGIMNAFARISKNASPQDTFIFYFAGHGVLSQEDQNFYLVPQDAVQIYGADASLSESGISSKKLRELSSQVQARKQLFILDACNSAGALLAFKERGASQEKAIAQLARSTGTHWIAASSGDQFATEFAELGHGAFTYTLLNGLNGDADSGDKRITINEIKAYVESMLPEVTKTYKGRPQYPASYGVGQDFPIALLP